MKSPCKLAGFTVTVNIFQDGLVEKEDVEVGSRTSGRTIDCFTVGLRQGSNTGKAAGILRVGETFFLYSLRS